MELMLLLVLLIGIDLIGRQGVEGNARGAPAGACVDLQPNQAAHGPPQEFQTTGSTSTVPYGVNMSPFRNNSITGYVYTPERDYVCKFNSRC